MKKLSTYLKQLNFDYAISYSGLRGKDFENLELKNKSQIKEIEEELKTARFMQKPKLRKKIQLLLDEMNIYNARVISKNGKLHKSAKAINKLNKEDERMKNIFKILETKFEEQVFVMCAPVFRDSIVFYSKESKITGILQICFSCLWLKNEDEEDMEIDYKVFPLLKTALLNIGHQIEDEYN